MIKRFLLSILAVILIPMASYSANWEEIHAVNNKKAYVDTQSINIVFPKMYYKIKYEKDGYYYVFDMASKYNERTTKILSIDKFDSEDKFIAEKEKQYYGKPSFYAETQEEKEEKLDPIQITPNSINEAVYNKVCSIVKSNNEKSDLMKSMLVPVKWKKETFSRIYDGNCVQILMKLKNTQDKSIIVFEGQIEVYDNLNNKLTSLKVEGKDKIEKQSIHTFNYAWGIWNIANMTKIYNTNSKDLNFVFKPTKIIFDDGTML